MADMNIDGPYSEPFTPLGLVPPDVRVYEHNGATYIFRDVWSDGSHVYKNGLKLVRCEYAVRVDGELTWKPCAEGSSFEDVEPAFHG
jgi:hypothetical protein